MPDQENELDATLQTAATTLKESNRLSGEAERGRLAMEEWVKAHEIDQALREKFFNALSPEDRKKARDEQEAFEREMAHDLDAAIQRAFPSSAKKGGGAKRLRSMA